MKFEDGTPITSKDIKYAITRTLDKDIFPDSPTYFDDLLAWPADYKGAYKSKDVNTDSAISTPDDKTIVFHLKNSFSSFDYLATTSRSYPVPAAKDTGAKYKEHPVSSVPTCSAGLRGGQEVHPRAEPELGPQDRPAAQGPAGRLQYTMNVNQEDIDNRIIAGELDVHVTGTGITPASQNKVLSDPTLKARADNPTLARLWYTSINPTVKPLDNKDCRIAIMYAMDRTAYQTAYGGRFAGGSIATSLMPALIPGAQGRLLPARRQQVGPGQGQGAPRRLRSAQRLRDQHGLPHRAAEGEALAEAFQAELAKVGIKLTLKGYPKKDYFSTYAGNPPFVVKNNISSPRTAGAPTGTTATASSPRSSTAGSSGRPAAARTRRCGSPRSTRCSTRLRWRPTTPSARRCTAPSTRRSWKRP